MVAVAPLWSCAVPSAAAVPAAATAIPAASRPETNVAAARRAAPRPRTDSAENAENTEYPFGQDPLTSGVAVPPAESVAPRAVFGILGTRSCRSSRDAVGRSIRLGIVIARPFPGRAYRQVDQMYPERIRR